VRALTCRRPVGRLKQSGSQRPSLNLPRVASDVSCWLLVLEIRHFLLQRELSLVAQSDRYCAATECPLLGNSDRSGIGSETSKLLEWIKRGAGRMAAFCCNCSLLLLAHSVTSRRRNNRSLSAHSGHRVSRNNQARFMSTCHSWTRSSDPPTPEADCRLSIVPQPIADTVGSMIVELVRDVLLVAFEITRQHDHVIEKRLYAFTNE